MKYKIRYKPMFSAIFVLLEPGDSLIAEAGAMASMNAELSMTTQFSGGFFNGLIR
ncbi:MAG: AIM24 family protein, partial [Cyanobacteriota bacterium]|nr:AIM24 family protein [Cyanobacteriota bacterium]